MCKRLVYNQLLVICLLGWTGVVIGQETQLYQSRSLEIDDQYDKGLYHHALYASDPYLDLYPANAIDRQRLVGLLKTRYPELTHALEQAPGQTISGDEVSALLVEILKDQSAASVTDSKDPLWQVTEETDLPREQAATFKFLYAYEMFKQRRLQEADKIFDEIISHRKGEHEYASYYSGLIALIQGDYARAHERLKKVGKNEQLVSETPYYLAVAHYGSKNYDELIRHYGPRIDDPGLARVEEIAKLVAFAQFKNGDFQQAIAALDRVKGKRDLDVKENYVYGTSLSKLGRTPEAEPYLTQVASVESELAKNAQYQQALNLAASGQTANAIRKFEELLGQRAYDPVEVKYNLALLHGRQGDHQQLAKYSLELLATNKKSSAQQLLAKSLDQITDDGLFKRIVRKININTTDKKTLIPSIYHRALAALQKGDRAQATEYFDLLAEVDPLVEERGSVAAWKGIMAYQDQDYSRASRLLSNYIKSLKNDRTVGQLEFDANYFLAYSYYRLKKHGKALGHFSNALAILHQERGAIQHTYEKSSDLHLRMGDCYFLTDQYKSAIDAYDYVIESKGAKTDYAIWQNATIAELEGRPYDQIILLEDMVAEYPTSKYVNPSKFAIANALFSISKYDRAAQYYKDLVATTDGRIHDESMMQLGLISVNAGAYAIAENYFTQIANSHTDQDLLVQSRKALKELYKEHTNDTDAYLALISDKEDASGTAQALYDLAKDNFEKGELDIAVEQWQKYIKDYPGHQGVDQAQLYLGDIAFSKSDFQEAIEYYQKVSADHADAITIYKKSEAIAYTQLDDKALYVSLIDQRLHKLPTVILTQDEQFKMYRSHVQLENEDMVLLFGEGLLSDAALSDGLKKDVVLSMSEILISEKKWQGLLSLYVDQKSIVNHEPKMIYQRALALMNTSKLDEAAHAVTDHYDTLIEEPAWLAKGILLVADVYLAKDDKDSAEAALEALISSDGDVPASLIAHAKKKLKELNPTN